MSRGLHRYSRFDQTIDPARQRELAAELQRRFGSGSGDSPCFRIPHGEVYNTRRFEGFPSEGRTRMPNCLEQDAGSPARHDPFAAVERRDEP